MSDSKTGLDMEIALAMADFNSLGEGKLAIEKISALMTLHAIARAYRMEGVPEDIIIRPIILKKIAFILAATTKAQLQEILGLPKVRYQLREQVDLVQEFDRLADAIVAEAIWLAKNYEVCEETYPVIKTRLALTPAI